MAASEVFSPLTCSICLENKDKQSPRILPCHHSFCEKCLELWHTNRKKGGEDHTFETTCPVCRKRASLPIDGVKALPVDFRLEQFASFLDSKEFIMTCQACDHSRKFQPAKAVCKTCKLQFCEECSEKHIKMPIFSSHQIDHAMCGIHGAALEYICETCLLGVCVKCVHSETHKKHKILDADSELPVIQKKLENLKSELEQSISASDSEIESKVKQCLERQRKSEENITNAGEELKRTIDYMVKETINLHMIQHKALLEELFEKWKKGSKCNASASEEIGKLLRKDKSHILMNIKKVNAWMEQKSDVEKGLQSSLSGPIFLDQCCPLLGFDKVKEYLKKYSPVCNVTSSLPRTQSNLILLKEVECGVTNILDSPWRVTVTPTGDAVVCNINGDVCEVFKDGTVQLFPGLDQVSAACIYKDDILMITKNGQKLIKMSEDHDKEEIDLDVQAYEPRGIATFNDTLFICSELKIIKHSLVDHSDEVTCVPDIGHPGSLACTFGDAPVLAVTERVAHKVVICDQNGIVKKRFGEKGSQNGQMNTPIGIKGMPNGHVLVADWRNHRISEYRPDGTFVQNVLSKNDGLYYPIDVAFLFPYVWVTEHVTFKGSDMKKRSVKLFKYS